MFMSNDLATQICQKETMKCPFKVYSQEQNNENSATKLRTGEDQGIETACSYDFHYDVLLLMIN